MMTKELLIPLHCQEVEKNLSDKEARKHVNNSDEGHQRVLAFPPAEALKWFFC